MDFNFGVEDISVGAGGGASDGLAAAGSEDAGGDHVDDAGVDHDGVEEGAVEEGHDVEAAGAAAGAVVGHDGAAGMDEALRPSGIPGSDSFTSGQVFLNVIFPPHSP